jgi:hypothetical protein
MSNYDVIIIGSGAGGGRMSFSATHRRDSFCDYRYTFDAEVEPAAMMRFAAAFGVRWKRSTLRSAT